MRTEDLFYFLSDKYHDAKAAAVICPFVTVKSTVLLAFAESPPGSATVNWRFPAFPLQSFA